MTKPRRRSPTLLLQAFCAFLLLLPSTAQTLSAPKSLEGLDEEDREALETLATRDASLRDAALLGTQHVDMLVEVQRIQEQSSERFRESIEDQPEDVQELIWEVVQVPGLLEELGTDGPRSGEELDAIVARQDPKLENAIRTLGRSHYSLLGEMLRIDRVAWDRFDALTEDLPDASQQALRKLVDDPELLSILARRVRLAVYLGDSYREDPEATRRHLAELGSEVAARDTAAEEEWRTAMESDEEATADLERSARFYADEYGYDYDDLTDYETVTTVRTVVHHYPYWFGYPTRYTNHYLYPYGYWYDYPIHLGFYFGGRGHHYGHRVHFGVPSRHYLHWYFGNHHDRHYKHLSHRFRKHHDTHRYARDHRYRTLSHWDRHRDRRDRHGDWHRGKRHQRDGHGFREGHRRDDRHHGKRFSRDRDDRHHGKRFSRDRDDRHDGRWGHFAKERERTRRGDEHGRHEGDRKARRRGDRQRDRDEQARPGRDRRRDEAGTSEGRRDARRARPEREARDRHEKRERQAEARRNRRDADAAPSEREVRKRRPERERKADVRGERARSETRKAPKRPRKAEFREARAEAREARQLLKAGRSERPDRSLRKAAKRAERRVQQAPKRSARQVRKANHQSPPKVRSAKASRRSEKAGGSGGGSRRHQGRRR